MGFLRNDAGEILPPFGVERFPWIGGDLQTIRHYLRHDAPVPDAGEEVLIELADGDRLLAAFHPSTGTRSKGCVIAVHGLNGCMNAQHIWWLVPEVLAAGYSLLRVNMRGAGPGRPLARKTYNACAGGDLVPFVDAAATRDPSAPLFMMAHSLGGTAALNMALDFPGAAARLAGIVTIGTPLDMVATSRKFSRLRNLAYGRHMLSALKQLTGDAPDIHEDTLAAAHYARSITEFDELVTAPMAGFVSADEYYRAASVDQRLHQIAVPVLVLQGSNDPWVPVSPCLSQSAPQDPLTGISVVVTRGGGHIGFHDSRLNWHIRATLAWCDAVAGAG